jgi:hypothetical protein
LWTEIEGAIKWLSDRCTHAISVRAWQRTPVTIFIIIVTQLCSLQLVIIINHYSLINYNNMFIKVIATNSIRNQKIWNGTIVHPQISDHFICWKLILLLFFFLIILLQYLLMFYYLTVQFYWRIVVIVSLFTKWNEAFVNHIGKLLK